MKKRYTVWRINTEPQEIILETDDRAEMMKCVSKLVLAGETHETIRVEVDESIPEPDMGSYFY